MIAAIKLALTGAFTALRTNLLAVVTFIGGLLFGLMKYYQAKSERATKRAEQAEKTLQYKEHVAEVETEIDNDFSDLKREAKADIRKGEAPKNLTNPNEGW